MQNKDIIKKTHNSKISLVKNEILGVYITNETQKNILEYVIKSIEDNTKYYYITTPNPEIIVFAHKHPEFTTTINKAEIALCDGVGVSLAGRLLHKPFVERITGIDFMIALCGAVGRKPITVGFLGGRQGVAELTAECLQKQFPTLEVVFIQEEWPDNSESKSKSSYKMKNPKPNIDILFVAFGFPKQEEWMAQHVGKIPVKVMIGVGGAFDYVSGRVPRAPKFVQAIGFEWLYRLFSQPWRWKRQVALGEFILLVFKNLLFARS